MNCDIYNDSDPWSSTITEQLLDRLVVEGNCAFTLFALLGLLQTKSSELLAVDDASVLRDTLINLPWNVLAADMPALIEKAEALYYKFAPQMLLMAPTETVDAWIAARFLSPCKLIPALVRYDQHRHHEMAKGNTELGEVCACV